MELTNILSDLGQRVSIGTHHDTMPSTSRASVHDSETIKFKGVIEESKELLVEQFLLFFNAFRNKDLITP